MLENRNSHSIYRNFIGTNYEYKKKYGTLSKKF